MPIVVVSQRAADGGPVLEEGEVVATRQSAVSLLWSTRSEGSGTLYVTNRQIVWLSDSASAGGGGGGGTEAAAAASPAAATATAAAATARSFAVSFSTISIHAISRDPSHTSAPCLYCQLDVPDDDYTELRLVPSDPTVLDSLFEAFSRGAQLNPDPVEEAVDADGDEEDDGWVCASDIVGVDGGDAQQQQENEEEEEEKEQSSGGDDDRERRRKTPHPNGGAHNGGSDMHD